MDFPIKNGDFPQFFVCLPEGIPGHPWNPVLRLRGWQEQLAAEAMDAWCAATMEVPSEAARRSFGDLSFAAEEAVDLY